MSAPALLLYAPSVLLMPVRWGFLAFATVRLSRRLILAAVPFLRPRAESRTSTCCTLCEAGTNKRQQGAWDGCWRRESRGGHRSVSPHNFLKVDWHLTPCLLAPPDAQVSCSSISSSCLARSCTYPTSRPAGGELSLPGP